MCRFCVLNSYPRLAGKRCSLLPFQRAQSYWYKVHGFYSLGLCYFCDSFISDQGDSLALTNVLCSLSREERSFLLIGVRQWPTSDTHHLQKPQPRVEQSFYIVSALASRISRSSFNWETSYPWYVWGRLGLLSGTFCPVLCAKNEFYCFFLLKTFYPFIL